MPLVFKGIEYGRHLGRSDRPTATLSFEGALNDVPVDLEITLPWPADADPAPRAGGSDMVSAASSSRSEERAAISESA